VAIFYQNLSDADGNTVPKLITENSITRPDIERPRGQKQACSIGGSKISTNAGLVAH
jgi:hypothetical protein